MNHLLVNKGRFHAYSAGSAPKGYVHPMTLEVLQKAGFATEGLRSKSWEEFAAPDAPKMDFVFTVCDDAAREPCPVWPGQPITAHWGMADPAAVEGPESRRRHAFEDALMVLHQRIELFASLPLESIDSLTLQHHVTNIGKK